MSPGGIWIVDGHNVIYRIDELRALQTADRRQEARDGLVDRCRRFAMRKGRKAVVVFDGRDDVSGPAPPNRRNLRVVFAGEEEKADTRIVTLARNYRRDGRSVIVVTDDTGLRGRLPRGVSTLGAAEFWERTRTGATGPEKPSFSAPDIEAHFLEAERRMLEEPEPPGPGKPRGKKKKGG